MSLTIVDLSSARDALEQLVGLQVHDTGRAAEIRKFSFGDLRSRVIRNRAARVADLSLHISCPWRILDGGALAAGTYDLARAAAAIHRTPSPEHDSTVRRIFSSSKIEVIGVDFLTDDSLTIRWSRGLSLEVVADAVEDEQWRLFAPGEPGDHLVVERTDGDLRIVLER